MALDPLSASTRTNKRNLLVLSTIAITIKAFNVSVEKIPLAGLNISFDKGALAFLLISSIIYFALSFFLYYMIDIKDAEKAPHHRASEENFAKKIRGFRSSAAWSATEQMRQTRDGLPPNYRLIVNDQELSTLFEKTEKISYRVAYEDFRAGSGAHGVVWLVEDVRPNDARQVEHNSKHDELYAPVIRIAQKRLRLHKWKSQCYRVALLPIHLAVETMYMARNYGLDGAFPLILATIALAGMYDLVEFKWITSILPPAVTR